MTVSTVRYYEIRRTDLVVDHALGPFAAPTLADAVTIADRRVGTGGLRWGSWEVVECATGDVVARGPHPTAWATAGPAAARVGAG